MSEMGIGSAEVERALIGSLLEDSGCLAGLELRPDQFGNKFFGDVYKAMTELEARGDAVNVITVTAELRQSDAYKNVSLLDFALGVPPVSLSAVETYAAEIARQAVSRNALRIASEIAKAAYSGNDVVSLTAGLTDEFVRHSGGSSDGVKHISVFGSQLFDEVTEAIHSPRDRWGFETGFYQFDEITGGIQPGEVIVLSGEPGIGKSSYAMQLCIGMAQRGVPGAIYELEMSGIALSRRAIASASKVFSKLMRTGRMNSDEISRFTDEWAKFNELPIFLNDNSSWTALGIKADLARAIPQHGIRWVLIDYMGLLQDEPGLPYVERSALISDRIHQIAKDLSVAVIAVHDMTKAGISGNESGQAQVAGSRKVLFNAHQIIVLRKEDEHGDRLRVKWEKFREGLSGSYLKLERVPGFAAFKEC